MADLIKIKGGKGETPELAERELAFNYDEQALYIGTKDGTKRLCGVGDVALLQAQIDELKNK